MPERGGLKALTDSHEVRDGIDFSLPRTKSDSELAGEAAIAQVAEIDLD